ncbi:MAG: thioredoxin family protein [Peptococcaceae bacterium]|nr:thioredoxin family protein [Candidatus Syntrophopropionicum ammoniitolerans]
MIIKILGTGCANCNKLVQNTKKAVAALGIAAAVEKVQDMKAIAGYGVMRLPALVIDEEVKVVGKILKVDEIKELLK